MRFKTIDDLFKITLIIKTFDSLIEVLAGIALFLINPNQISNFLKTILNYTLIKDPKDILANYLIAISQKITISSHFFLSFYLLTHGVIKIFLIIALLKRRLWAYPLAIAIFTFFAIYQIYIMILGYTSYYLLLTILDVIVILLTLVEYGHLRRKYKIHNP